MPSASQLRVFIVDDQLSMRGLVRAALQSIGVQDIRDDGSPASALPRLREDPPHLIISDFNMEGMDGLEFLAAVRADPKIGNVPFIMLTGSADRQVVQRAAALKVNNYVVKPFNVLTLRQKIEAVFGPLT